MKKADTDGNYMSVQNIKEILSMASFLSSKIQKGDQMEDWVEDKISASRQMLNDLVRFYSKGENEMGILDQWKFAKQDSAEGGADTYFADIPYYRETKEFAESGESTNHPDIDPAAAKNTPPTPSEVNTDENVKTLGRVKVEEVKQDKKGAGAWYDGLNRKQRNILDQYLKRDGGVADFDDLPHKLQEIMYKTDDLAQEFTMGHTGHYQLEESVEKYLYENDPQANRVHQKWASSIAELLANWTCLGEG